MEQEKKAAILATVERLSSTTVPSAPLRTLASEMRKKPSQRTLVPPIVKDAPINAKLLDLVITKLGEDGYVVSHVYATKFLRKHDEKLVPAIKAIKHDLDVRESTLHKSGRISVSQQIEECAGTPSFQTRDQIISLLEVEDSKFREIAEKGWDSAVGRSLRVNLKYKSEKEREEAMAFYVQETKFRNARAEFYKSCEKQLHNLGELEKCMQEWESGYKESKSLVPDALASRVEQAARAGGTAKFPQGNFPAYQAKVEDEDESENDNPVTREDGQVSIDDIMERVKDVVMKPQEIRVHADEIAELHLAYDPYEKIASTAETFRMNAQVAAYEIAKLTKPMIEDYRPEQMDKRNFPKTLINALDSQDFYSEDGVVDCFKYLAETMGNENAKLRKEKITLKQERVEREARREEERVTKMTMDILDDLNYTPPHAGKTLELLLAVIPKMVTGPKLVTKIQMLSAKRDIIKNIRQIYEILVESEGEQIHIHELREHMKGKTVFAALSEAYSDRNLKCLDPILTDGMRGELVALFNAAKQVDAQITATELFLMQEASRENARANVNRPIKDFVDMIGETYMAIHGKLMEIPYSHPKRERMRRDLEERQMTFADSLQEEWKYAIRGTIYDRVKNDTLEAIWHLIVQAAKDIDTNLREKPKKKLAVDEELESSLLDTILDQLRIPLMELLPREADMPRRQSAGNRPNSKHNRRGNYPEEAVDEFDGKVQQIMQKAEDHNLKIQKAFQDSLEVEKNRKLKKPVNTSEGLRKMMAKANVEKRLSEVVAGGAASGEIDLKEGVQVWNEEHVIEPTTKSAATVHHISNGMVGDDVTIDQKLIDFAVSWWNTKGRYGAKLSGHENCNCSAEQHAELVEIMKITAETAQKLGFASTQRAAAQTTLAGLDTEEVAQRSAKPLLSFGQKPKGNTQNKTTSKQARSIGRASGSTSQLAGSVAASRYPPGYDTTPSVFKDAISETTGEPLDIETLRLHDRLLKLNMDIAAGAWCVLEHEKESRKHVVKLTGMEIDWSPTALNICGNSAAFAVAFVSAASEEVKKYLAKKGLPIEQWRIDYEGYRFGLRCQDHFVNQLEISLGKKPKYQFGYGFNTGEVFHGVPIPTLCDPPPSDSSDTPTEGSGGSQGWDAVLLDSSAGFVLVAPSSSTPNSASGPSSNITKASSSTTGPPPAHVSQLATIIQNTAKPSISHNLALQITNMIEDGVSTVAAEAAKVPGLTSEMVIALASDAQIPLPPQFNANPGATSRVIKAMQTDTTGASSTASLNTGPDTTPSGYSGGGQKKKKRQAVKKGGRHR